MTWRTKLGQKTTEPKPGRMERYTSDLCGTLVSSLPVGVYVVQNRKFQFANPQFQKYTAFGQDELLGMDSLSIVYSDDRVMVRENAVRMLKGESSAPYEFRIITKGRQIRWIMEMVTSIQHGGKRAALGSCIDMTQQIGVKKSLEELGAWGSCVLDAISTAVVVLRNHRIIFASDAVEAVFGWRPEELIGKTTEMLFHTKEEYEEASTRLYSVLEQQTVFTEELHCRRRDGKDIACVVKGSRIADNSKENKVVATFEDISERAKMDEELQKQRHELNRRIKELNCLYTISNLTQEQDISLEEILNGIVSLIPLAFRCPETTCARLILEEREFRTGDYQETSHKQARDIIVEGKRIGSLEVCYSGERPENGQEPFRGEEIHLINTIAAQLGGIVRYRRAQEMLRNTEANLRHIITNNADGMIVVDKNGVPRFVNPAAEALFSRKAEELLGASFGYPVVAGEKTEVDIVRKGGEAVTAEMHTVEIEWNGESACLTSLRDVTERKRVEQLKDEFIGTVSHELRTPLSVIKEAVKLVLDEIPGPIVEEQRDILTTAEEYIGRISRIIDSGLDICRIASGELELQMSFVNLAELIEEVVTDFMYLAEEKRIGLDCEIAEEEINVYCEVDKIKQVLINLISNALKFTAQGGRVKVVCRDQENEALVWVQDTGIGISQENISRLFDRFSQFGRKSGPAEEGAGLGLAISKGIVELHKGRIWAESKLNEGSKFYFTLPKLSSDQVFREHLSREIKQALRKAAYFSVVLLRPVNFEGLSQEAPEQAGEITKGIEAVIKSALRRESDLSLKDTGEFLIILPDTKKADAITVARRVEEKLREFLANQDNLQHEITFLTKVICYPEEAGDEHEILNKLREG